MLVAIDHRQNTAGTQANVTPTQDHEESKSEDSDEEQGEAAQVMEDDEEDEPLLQRETAGDVALDIDAGDYQRIRRPQMMRAMADLELEY